MPCLILNLVSLLSRVRRVLNCLRSRGLCSTDISGGATSTASPKLILLCPSLLNTASRGIQALTTVLQSYLLLSIQLSLGR